MPLLTMLLIVSAIAVAWTMLRTKPHYKRMRIDTNIYFALPRGTIVTVDEKELQQPDGYLVHAYTDDGTERFILNIHLKETV